MPGDLHAEAVDRGQAVERPAGHVRDEDREAVAAERRRAVAHVEPEQRLPHHASGTPMSASNLVAHAPAVTTSFAAR